MLTMPDLLEFDGEWTSYIDNVYQEFQDSFLNSGIRFRVFQFALVTHLNTIIKNSVFGI